MKDLYSFTEGQTPILVSMPHSGVFIPESILCHLNESAKSVPDTDWHIPRLYDFVIDQGHSVLQANYSRYVVDLNRPADDQSLYPGQATTGLCPDLQFNGEPLYLPGKAPDQAEIMKRRGKYWQPYHDKLDQTLRDIKSRFGYAILYDAHSIASRIPRLFDGQLPDLNLGTVNGKSCASVIQDAIVKIIEGSDYRWVTNGRFRGGYITRHYGCPDNNVHAVQMEIAQCTYMNESGDTSYNNNEADKLKQVLQRVFVSFTRGTVSQTVSPSR